MDHHTWIFTTVICFFFQAIISLPTASAAAAGIPSNTVIQTDGLALLNIKAKVTSDPSHALSSWNTSLNFCEWQGVTCSPRQQRVIMLNLTSLGLVGSLSPHVGNLTFLGSLILSNNSFHGEIPPEVGRLSRLQVLMLNTNSFVGKIPVNMSHCTSLRRLFLSLNMLEGDIPIELTSLPQIAWLVLDRNLLTGGIPPSIGNLSLLQTLSLGQNNLGGSIPESLSKLKSLWWLRLNSNMLFGTVPRSFYNMSSLKIVYLVVNQLTGSLPHITNLPNLQEFGLGENQFSGTIPVSLFNASGLQILTLSQNNFSGKVPTEVGRLKGLQQFLLGTNSLGNGEIGDVDFVTSLTNCTNLTTVDISYNQLGGILPNSIANFSIQLFMLFMGKNQLHGSIPSGIQNCVNLIALSMYDNFFTGSIPFSIGKLQKLQVLRLDGNRLSGEFPSSVANMSNLFFLDLGGNILEGNVIADITKCGLLQEVYLTDNKFNGTLPEGVIDLSSGLLVLDLAHNSFTGSLPMQLGNFENLRSLDVSQNKMSGDIPSTIGGCWSLQYLSLKGNYFEGPIPTSFSTLKDLSSLDLSANNLSGEIPRNLGYLASLQNLNLSFNNLNGELPREGIFKNTSAFSILGNDKLCGGIPELQLPACHIKNLKRRSMSSTSKVILSVALFSIVVAFFIVVALYCKTRAGARPEAKFSEDPVYCTHFEKVSYRDLYEATSGFSLSNLIGVGSFGSVYKGIVHDGLVAVKVLNLIERGASKSFIRECEALSKIRHRNLVKILTICSSVDFRGKEFKAIVLKFMPNGSLESYLHPRVDQIGTTNALSLFKRINMAIDIASALDYLHNHCERPIVHCDLKPSNILLDEHMTAHVGDFGLAKFLQSSDKSFNTHESNSATTQGTIGYIPPEYGMGAQASPQGDVYSFGILLLEMFTGKRPTAEMFKDGLSLHKFSSMSLPLRVMDIVDPRILRDEEPKESITKSTYQRDMSKNVEECIAYIVKIGVECSVNSQSERIRSRDALRELQVVKEYLLELGYVNKEKHIDQSDEV